MKLIDVYKLKLNQIVGIKQGENTYNCRIVCINDWTKRIGFVNADGEYDEVPYRNVVIYSFDV